MLYRGTHTWKKPFMSGGISKTVLRKGCQTVAVVCTRLDIALAGRRPSSHARVCALSPVRILRHLQNHYCNYFCNLLLDLWVCSQVSNDLLVYLLDPKVDPKTEFMCVVSTQHATVGGLCDRKDCRPKGVLCTDDCSQQIRIS